VRQSVRSRLPLVGGVCLLSFLGLGVGDGGLAAEQERAQAFAKLERGMTPEQVQQRVGTPRRIARQILSHRYLEQWIYDSPFPIRIQFDCPRGQKPQLVWKQP
jgi:hypothetical protein